LAQQNAGAHHNAEMQAPEKAKTRGETFGSLSNQVRLCCACPCLSLPEKFKAFDQDGEENYRETRNAETFQ